MVDEQNKNDDQVSALEITGTLGFSNQQALALSNLKEKLSGFLVFILKPDIQVENQGNISKHAGFTIVDQGSIIRVSSMQKFLNGSMTNNHLLDITDKVFDMVAEKGAQEIACLGMIECQRRLVMDIEMHNNKPNIAEDERIVIVNSSTDVLYPHLQNMVVEEVSRSLTKGKS